MASDMFEQNGKLSIFYLEPFFLIYQALWDTSYNKYETVICIKLELSTEVIKKP